MRDCSIIATLKRSVPLYFSLLFNSVSLTLRPRGGLGTTFELRSLATRPTERIDGG